MSEQIAVRLPDELASSLDQLISEGRFESKAEAIRSAIRALVEQERRSRIGERIADGYRRIPQSDEEVSAATEAAIHSIQEEPW
jgi:putative addiction module CopG family antidote